MTDARQDQTVPLAKRRVIIVTGMSGAGKSSALNAFEDLGYQSVDNLPLDLIGSLLDVSREEETLPLAVGVDSRTLHFSPDEFQAMVTCIKETPDVDLHILFMDAANETLVKRYSETRRRHPLSKGQPLRDAIRQERDLMADVRLLVDGILDTSQRTGAETRRVIVSRYGLDGGVRLVTMCMSFGYANGVPKDADLVFDVRFLRNPHYEEALKAHTGLDDDVANYVRADESFYPFIDRLQGLLALLLPRYRAEGKSYLTLAFGCTGGKHRSVMMAETFAEILGAAGQPARAYHRDLAENYKDMGFGFEDGDL